MNKLKKNKKKNNEKVKSKLKKSLFATVAVVSAMSTFAGNINNVHAETHHEELKSRIVKSPYYLGNSAMGYQDQGFHIYIDSSWTKGNKTAFCLDPTMAIKNGVVYTTREDLKDKITPRIQRIAYLGYHLPASKHNGYSSWEDWKNSGEGEKAYINTQAMIWEELGVDVRVNTPNYASFKKKVNEGIRKWELRPSIHNMTISIKEGETKTISDKNKVLSEFKNYDRLTDLGGVTIKGNDDNTLTITANKNIASATGNKKYIYNSVKHNSFRHNPTEEVNLIYESDESQTLATMGHVDPLPYTFNIDVKQKYDDVDITKLDATSKKELPGAKLEVIHKKTGKVVDKWISTNKAHTVKNLTVDDKYILRETMAKDGYDYAKDIEFIVDGNGRVNKQHIIMEDEKITGSLELTKLDADNGKEQAEGLGSLDNAEYDVIDDVTGKSVGKLIYDYDTKKSNRLTGLNVLHTYTLKEVKSPKGYHLGCFVDGKLVSSGKIKFDWKKVQDKNSSNNNILINKSMKDSVTKVRINKLDNLDPKIGKHVKGATLTLLDKETNKKIKLNYNDKYLPFEWVSTGKYLEIRGLEIGHTYVLQEIHAPNGYKISKDVEFTVEKDRAIQNVYMVDTKTDDVGITKVDITTQKELPGAHLEIIDKETGEIVEKWISTEKEHVVRDLEVNKTYILKETIAPDGYAIAHQKEFIVKDNGAILQHEKMEDSLLPSKRKKKTTDKPQEEVKQVVEHYVESVKTGDPTAIAGTISALGLSGLTISVLAMRKKRKQQ